MAQYLVALAVTCGYTQDIIIFVHTGSICVVSLLNLVESGRDEMSIEKGFSTSVPIHSFVKDNLCVHRLGVYVSIILLKQEFEEGFQYLLECNAYHR